MFADLLREYNRLVKLKLSVYRFLLVSAEAAYLYLRSLIFQIYDHPGDNHISIQYSVHILIQILILRKYYLCVCKET